jgi:8-oxo-dGTP diphosphatase
MPHTYPYPRPALTADAVVFTIQDQKLQILLIQRGGEPFAGRWALPGGFVEEGESAAEGVRRELEEEAGLRDISFEQLRTFDASGRDPRGWTVSVAHVALIDLARVDPVAADDAADARWWPTAQLPALAFDHDVIIAYALKHLRETLRWSTIGSQLLPPLFTMEALRRVHEAILEDTLDQTSFHQRMVESGLVRDSGTQVAPGKGEPQPPLYAFVSPGGE